MRHRSGLRKLNITDGAHRRALLRNVGNAVIRHERVKTTLIRAKEVRRYVEPLITLGKKPSVANRRLAFSRLRDRDNVVKLFNDLGVRFANRPGGYLRILKHGYRVGDNAPMALVELVDRKPDVVVEKKKPKPKKQPAAKAATATPAAAAADEAPGPSPQQVPQQSAESSAAAANENSGDDAADSKQP